MSTSPQASAAKTDWKLVVQEFLLSKPSKPLIVVLGPTASGKTRFSIELSHYITQKHAIDSEIINADSRQIYRRLDIGTAKISSEEMQGVPHHLLSVLDPKKEVTIAWYQKEAQTIIEEIQSRGSVPMLVGGSMLYISAIIDGLHPIASDPAIRERLSSDYDADDGMTLMKRLMEIDPESAASIPRENKIYVIRALEIFEATGTPKSAQKKNLSCPYDLLIFGIDRDPEELKNRINKRTQQMLTAGWIEEVSALKAQGYTEKDPGMMSHGYREIFQMLEQCGPEGRAGEKNNNPQSGPPGRNLRSNDLAEKISSNVRKYAKRQRTWWRNDSRIHWIQL